MNRILKNKKPDQRKGDDTRQRDKSCNILSLTVDL